MSPPPLPLHLRDNVVLFSVSNEPCQQRYDPGKILLDYFSLETMEVSLPVCFVGKLSQLILSPIVGYN